MSEATIKEAVNYASFENMRRLVFNERSKKVRVLSKNRSHESRWSREF